VIYEAFRSKVAGYGAPVGDDEWRVEAIDHEGEGECYVATFSGPLAKQRAEEYADWKNAYPAEREG
jgi:hypothetical protein